MNMVIFCIGVSKFYELVRLRYICKKKRCFRDSSFFIGWGAGYNRGLTKSDDSKRGATNFGQLPEGGGEQFRTSPEGGGEKFQT